MNINITVGTVSFFCLLISGLLVAIVIIQLGDKGELGNFVKSNLSYIKRAFETRPRTASPSEARTSPQARTETPNTFEDFEHEPQAQEQEEIYIGESEGLDNGNVKRRVGFRCPSCGKEVDIEVISLTFTGPFDAKCPHCGFIKELEPFRPQKGEDFHSGFVNVDPGDYPADFAESAFADFSSKVKKLRTDWKLRRDLGFDVIFLLVGTWILEIPGAIVRFIILSLVAVWVVLLLSTLELEPAFLRVLSGVLIFIAFVLAFSNLIISGLTAFGLIPIGLSGRQFTRFAMGARPPSKREREKVRDAFVQIRDITAKKILAGIKAPEHWFVLDNPLLAAHPIGATLYITKGLINSDHLVPVLAHNLGHLNATDARLTLALRRLILPPVFFFNSTTASSLVPGLFSAPAMAANQVGVNQIIGLPQEKTVFLNLPNPTMIYFMGIWLYVLLLVLSITGGGLGLLLLSPLWIWHFRERDYTADYFAARCGLAPQLIEYLEAHQFFDAAVPYFLSVQPYTELRIDKLLTYLERHS